MKKKIIFFCHF
jgi:hypothetical protein